MERPPNYSIMDMNAITIDICEIDDKGTILGYGFLPKQNEGLLQYNFTKIDAGGQYLLITGPHFERLGEYPLIIEQSTPNEGPLSTKMFPEFFSTLNPNPSLDLLKNPLIYLNFENGIYSYAKEDESGSGLKWVPFARAYQYTEQPGTATSNRFMLTPMSGGSVSVSRANGVLEMSALDYSGANKPIFSKSIGLTVSIENSEGKTAPKQVANGDVYNIDDYNTTRYDPNWVWSSGKTPLSYDTSAGKIVLYKHSNNVLEYSPGSSYQVIIYRNKYTTTCTLTVTPVPAFGGLNDLEISDGWTYQSSNTNADGKVTYTFTHGPDIYEKSFTFEASQVNNKDYYTMNSLIAAGEAGKNNLAVTAPLTENIVTDTINYELLIYDYNTSKFEIAKSQMNPQYTSSGTALAEFEPYDQTYIYTGAVSFMPLRGPVITGWTIDNSIFSVAQINNKLSISRHRSSYEERIQNYRKESVYVYSESSGTLKSNEQSIVSISQSFIIPEVSSSSKADLLNNTYQIIYFKDSESYYASPKTITEFNGFISGITSTDSLTYNYYIGSYSRSYTFDSLTINLDIQGDGNNKIKLVSCSISAFSMAGTSHVSNNTLSNIDSDYVFLGTFYNYQYRVFLEGDRLRFQQRLVSSDSKGQITYGAYSNLVQPNNPGKIHTIQSLVGAPVHPVREKTDAK